MKLSLTFRKVAVTFLVAVALVLLTLCVSFSLTMGNSPVAKAEGEVIAPTYTNADSTALQVTEIGGGISRFGDATFEIESLKGDGETLIAVYAIYESEPNVKLTLHNSGNKYTLFGVRENFTLVGEWVATWFEPTWVCNSSQGTITSATPTKIQVGIGLPLEEMPSVNGAEGSSSMYYSDGWSVSGTLKNGSSYSLGYIPKDAISATCTAKLTDGSTHVFYTTSDINDSARPNVVGEGIFNTDKNKSNGTPIGVYAAGDTKDPYSGVDCTENTSGIKYRFGFLGHKSNNGSGRPYNKRLDAGCDSTFTNDAGATEYYNGMGFYREKTSRSSTNIYDHSMLIIPVRFDDALKRDLLAGTYSSIKVTVTARILVGAKHVTTSVGARTNAWLDLQEGINTRLTNFTIKDNTVNVDGYPGSVANNQKVDLSYENSGATITSGYNKSTTWGVNQGKYTKTIQTSATSGFTIGFRATYYSQSGGATTKHFALINSLVYTVEAVDSNGNSTEKQEYTINLDANTPSGAVAHESVKDGTNAIVSATSLSDSVELSSAPWAYEGYSFEGWNTMADGSGDMVTNLSVPTDATSATYYAIWKEKQYPFVTYDTYTDGTNKVSLIRESANITHGGEILLPDAGGGGNDYVGYGEPVTKYLPNGLLDGTMENLPIELDTTRGVVIAFVRELPAASVTLNTSSAEVDYGGAISLEAFVTTSHVMGDGVLSRAWKKVDGENLVDANSTLSKVVESGDYKALVTASVTIDGGIYGKELSKEVLSDGITCVINALPLTLAWALDGGSEYSLVYDAQEHVFTVVAEGEINEEVAELSVVGTLSSINVGEFEVSVTLLDTNYYLENEEVTTKTWSVTARPITLSWALDGQEDYSLVYNGQEHEFEVIINNAVDTVELDIVGTLKETNAGEYNVQSTIKAEYANYYLDGENQKTWSITALPVALAWTLDGNIMATSVTYDGQEHEVKAIVTNMIGADVVRVDAYEGDYTGKSNKGAYTATATGLDNANYTLDGGTNASFDWIIESIKIVASWNGDSFIYNGSAQHPDLLVSGFDAEDVVELKIAFYKDGYVVSEKTLIASGSEEYTFTEAEVALKSVIVNAGAYTLKCEAVIYDGNGVESVKYDFATAPADKEYVVEKKALGGSGVWKYTIDNGAENDYISGVTALAFTNYKYALVSSIDESALCYNEYNGLSDYAPTLNYSVSGGDQIVVGEYVTAFNFTSDNYVLGSNNSISWTIVPKTLGINWTLGGSSTLSKVYSGNEITLSATLSGVVAGTDCEISATEETFVATNAGSYIAKVTAISNSNYALPQENSVTWTITARPVAVEWTDGELTYNGQAQSVTAIVTNLAKESDVVTFTYTGNTQVFAGENYGAQISGIVDNTNYTVVGGSNLGKIWRIAPKAVALEWSVDKGSELNVTYNGNVRNLTVTASGVIGSDMVKINLGGTTSASAVGEYTATATGIVDNSNYALPQEKSITWSIVALPVVVEWTDGALVYNGQAQSVNATITNAISGEGVAFEYSDNTKTYVGEYTASILNLTNANYTLVGAIGATYDWSISAKEITIDWTLDDATDFALTYDGVTHVIKALPVGVVGADVVEITLSGDLSATNAGEYEATASFKETYSNYVLGGVYEKTWSIAQREVNIKWLLDGQEKTSVNYDGAEHVLTAIVINAQNGEEVTIMAYTGSVLSGNGSLIDGNKATATGSYQTAVLTLSDSLNYVLGEGASLTWSIDPNAISVAFSGGAFTYNGQAQRVTAIISGISENDLMGMNILTEGATADVTSEVNNGKYYVYFTATSAGEYKATVSGISGANEDNYVFVSATEYDFSIAPLTLVVEWDAIGGVYAKANYFATASASNKVESDVVNFTYLTVGDGYSANVNSAMNAGEYVTEVVAIDNENYALDGIVKVSWSISAKLLTEFTWGQNSFVYSGESYSVTASAITGATEIDDGKLYDGDVLDIVYAGAENGNTAINAGEYEVSVISLGNSNYYAENLKTTLVVARKDLIITSASNWSKTYDKEETYQDFSYEAIVGADLTISASFADENAGDKALTFVLGGQDVNNYAISLLGLVSGVDYVANGDYCVVNAGVAKILPKVVTAVGSVDKEFDGTRSANAFVIEEGIVNGDAVSVIGVYDSEMVGARNVTLTIDNANYALAVASLVGNVSPKAITLVWTAQDTYEYNAHDQAVNVSVSGMVSGYEESLSVTGDVEKSFIGSTKFNFKNAGDYSVTIALKANTNYSLEGQETTKAWSISKKVLAIVWDEENEFVYDGTTFEYAPAVNGIIDGDFVEISVTGTANSTAGTYTAVVNAISGASVDNYVLPENVQKDWSILKANVTGITFDGLETIYDGQVKEIVVSTNLTQYGDMVSVSYVGAENANSAKNAGEYLVVATIEESQNYLALILTATLKIAKAEITDVVFNGLETIYDGSIKSVIVSGTTTSFGDEIAVSYAISGTTLGGATIEEATNGAKNAGEYSVVATLDAGANYEVKTLKANLVINATALTFVWGKSGSESGIYDGEEHGVTFTSNGAIVGDEVRVSLLVNGDSVVVNAGEIFVKTFVNASEKAYEISVLGIEGADSANYVAEGTQTAAINIAKRNVVVEGFTFGASEFALGDALSFVYSKSLVEINPIFQEGCVIAGDDVQIKVEGNQAQDAGNYALTISLVDNDNYAMETISKAWEITPKTITVSWKGSTSVIYNGENHQLSASISGVIAGDDVQVTYENNVAKNAGAYTAKIKSISNANYKIDESDLTKTLIIKPAQILGVSIDDGEYLYDGNEYGLEVNGVKTQYGDKITVTIVTKDMNGKIVSNKVSTAGAYSVVAYVSAGKNYEDKTLEATLVIKSVVIESPKTEEQEKPVINIESDDGFAPGTTIEASSKEYAVNETPEIIISTLQENERVAMVYDVKLLRNGQEVALDSTVTIKLLVPENLANGNFRILSVVDGEEVELEYVMEEGYALIQAENVETFVIVCETSTTDYLQQYLLYIIIGALLLILVIVAIVVIAIKSKKHVINFVTGDVEVAGGSLSSMTVKHGKKVVLPEPSVGGLYFDGWYTDENCTKKANISKEDGFTPLYAKNGVNGRKGQAKLPGAFTKNLEFQGWYTDENCTQKADLKKLGKQDATLYAKWGSKKNKSKYPLWIDKD